ncbi:MAG: acyltransferase [Synechococcales cyanobacterium C42_A2020_086]|jgi:acetyltransferase-like isoleucine patch superfamily enzyme|nr:acyltransferase [Synechococcales cyanobacterium C42_A2020_086]
MAITETAQIIASQRRTALLTAVFGSIPLFIGKKLRQLAYRRIFRKMGASVTIDPDVTLVGTQFMELHDEVGISSHCFINCWEPTSRFVIRSQTRLDRGVHIQTHGGSIEIGGNTYLGPYVCMAGPGDISIGRHCMIASHCGIYANNHCFGDLDRPMSQQGVTCKGIVIEEDCWLGTGVKVLDGVTIGRGSVIGAGAVVTRDIPPYSIAVGVPAKVIQRRGASLAVAS